MGSNLRKLREEKNLTMQDLSDKLNIDRSAVSRLESGERSLNEYYLNLFADFFNVSTDYLLGRTTERPVLKHIEIPVIREAPLANTPEYQTVMNLVDRLTRDELIMLKGMILALLGNESIERERKAL